MLQKSPRSKPFVVHADKLKGFHSPPVTEWVLQDESSDVEMEVTEAPPVEQSPVVRPVHRKRKPSAERGSSEDQETGTLIFPKPRERKKPRYLSDYDCRPVRVRSAVFENSGLNSQC